MTELLTISAISDLPRIIIILMTLICIPIAISSIRRIKLRYWLLILIICNLPIWCFCELLRPDLPTGLVFFFFTTPQFLIHSFSFAFYRPKYPWWKNDSDSKT